MAQDQSPREGGVTDTDTNVNVDSDVFKTEGNQPIRDKTADPRKGTPVKRFFTKDGTPVEPATVPGAQTPSNLAGHDASKRDDVVEAWEYLNTDGSTVTHDNAKAAKEQDDAQKKDSDANTSTSSATPSK